MRRFTAEETGQNIVEFALLLPILMYILMGIMQFGLVFAAYLTINNAVREGARWGSISVYDTSSDPAVNDETRQDGVRERIIVGRGILNIPTSGSTSNFDSGDGTWASGTVATDCFNQSPTPVAAWKDGDITICYTKPTSVSENDARRGYFMEVTAWYHQQVFVPLLDTFLPDDTTKPSGEQGQWLRLPGRVTVVIN
ncbi:MAG: TadE/TadG family type IV pilus assembly protein [Candidatus Limnocylindria bacterium]